MQAFQNPAVQARFRFLGVELTDAESLFEMLDTADTDEMLIDEFVSVCLRAKTLTRPLDLQSFIQQSRRTDRWLRRALVNIERHLDRLADKMDKSAKRSESLLRNTTRRMVLQGLRSPAPVASPGSHTLPTSSEGASRSGRGGFVPGWEEGEMTERHLALVARVQIQGVVCVTVYSVGSRLMCQGRSDWQRGPEVGAFFGACWKLEGPSILTRMTLQETVCKPYPPCTSVSSVLRAVAIQWCDCVRVCVCSWP